MSINEKRNGMLFAGLNPARYSHTLLPKRNSAEGHKSSPANATPVALVTYKSFAPCANGLLFSLLLHAPAIKEAAQMDRECAIYEYYLWGIKPESYNGGRKLTLS